jgi:flagellar export protein FliJ
MAFHFPLDSLLRVRQGEERQQELLMREANVRVGVLQQQIGQNQQEIEIIATRRQLESTMHASELQFDALCRAVLLKQRRQLEDQLAEARTLQQSRRSDFQRARQQREVVDTLRGGQMEIYRQEQSRREQRQLDDMFLLRRAYLRGR